MFGWVFSKFGFMCLCVINAPSCSNVCLCDFPLPSELCLCVSVFVYRCIVEVCAPPRIAHLVTEKMWKGIPLGRQVCACGAAGTDVRPSGPQRPQATSEFSPCRALDSSSQCFSHFRQPIQIEFPSCTAAYGNLPLTHKQTDQQASKQTNKRVPGIPLLHRNEENE